MYPGLTKAFREFFASEKSGGQLLVACTIVSLVTVNSPLGKAYLDFWHRTFGGLSIEHWVNDALMAVFFLLIGLELERELYAGELSNPENALLPIFAALGGMIVPALIHFSLNSGTPMQGGFGIPMATDIAFSIGVLAILGNRVPLSLKIFIVAFAVIDDLGAIVVIALFYTPHLSIPYFAGALGVWAILIGLNRLRVMSLIPYLAGGVILWILMLKSGVHATLSGVMLAFAIPFSARNSESSSPSQTLEHVLHRPVAFIILPVFALANTGVLIGSSGIRDLLETNSLGIITGLVLGKPAGVLLFCGLAVAGGMCRLPSDLNWRHVFGAGILGGIGFTMSIFITNLAFPGNPSALNASKMAILLASLTAGISGFIWLMLFCGSGPKGDEQNPGPL
jgi:NhaA family Na+:H+ antiporter